MTLASTLTPKRTVVFSGWGGEAGLTVPTGISEPTLNKEIAGQDLIRKKLLAIIDKLEAIGNNRELLFCSEQKLQAITREFTTICQEVRKFFAESLSHRSAIPQLQEAREDVKLFFRAHLGEEIEEIELLEQVLFSDAVYRDRHPPRTLEPFRRRLAKCTGLVRTELQKMFAHLFACDPRNLFRPNGPYSQQEILFRQFRRDVEICEQLYLAIRKLDTYMRGAIIPSDVLRMIADKIMNEQNISCLFDSDHYFFMNALIDEVLEILLPELRDFLNLDGVWYDDFENVERKCKALTNACIEFRAFYTERSGLREEIYASGHGQRQTRKQDPALGPVIRVFETFRCNEVAGKLRQIDQVLIDLEGTLLQWEKGVAQRAFARPEWREAQPLQRRPSK